ncbi:MAG: hypothetical protein LBJ64_02830 [Deltaproteobacteria bacterium]|jgi:hypothetical protein|nr:hypothetical protein [Deltaproteobacteria bacterium]
MTIPKIRLVDVPDEKGVHIKAAGAKGEKYVYVYAKHYRNAEGKSRHKSISIGKIDDDSGKMTPNANYWSMYGAAPQPTEFDESSYRSYGFAYLAEKSCRDMGLWDCLQEAFGKKATEILATAAFILRCGNSMDGIEPKKNITT